MKYLLSLNSCHALQWSSKTSIYQLCRRSVILIQCSTNWQIPYAFIMCNSIEFFVSFWFGLFFFHNFTLFLIAVHTGLSVCVAWGRWVYKMRTPSYTWSFHQFCPADTERFEQITFLFSENNQGHAMLIDPLFSTEVAVSCLCFRDELYKQQKVTGYEWCLHRKVWNKWERWWFSLNICRLQWLLRLQNLTFKRLFSVWSMSSLYLKSWRLNNERKRPTFRK